MPIGTGIIYNVGDLILSQVSGSGTSFLETKIAAATSSIVYFDSTARINSASLSSLTVGTASYVSGSRSIITNLTASNISASGTGSFGMVGIGTTSPSAKLQIGTQTYGTAPDATYFVAGNDDFSGPGPVGAISGYPTAANRNQVTASIFDVVSGWEAVNGSHAILRASAYNVINSTPAFVVLCNGNVGIGTTSPSAKLEVSSSTAASLLNVKGVGGNGLLFVSGSGLVGIGTTSPTQKLEVQGNIQAGNDSTTTIGFKLTRLLGGVRTSEHTFHSANNSPWYTYGQNLNWTGELAGTVESTQAYRPYFEGFAPAAGYKIFGFMNTSSGAFTSANIVNSLVLKNDGNVGIGTDSPIAALDVRGRARVQNNTAATAFYVQQDDGSNDVVEFYRNATSNFILKNNGNVGIGTTAPAAKLEITGSSNSVLLNIKSAISGAILYVSGSGAVGIGTSNVGAYTLQVSGSFAATTKSFVIEHPTKAGKKLIYGSLESPYHGIRLTGRDTLVNGKSKIQLPDYIYKLILHDSVNIQLTGIKCNKTLYVDEINIPENYFTIAYDKAIFESYKDYDFFWDFTGIRTDVPELITEL